MNQKKFVDANVVLEILLGRKNWSRAVDALASEKRDLAISPLTVHLTYHFCLEQKVRFEKITAYLGLFRVLTLNHKMVALAQERYRGNDFEDCLQAACAELGGCDEIITFDEKFKADSGTKLKVTVIS